MWIPVGFGLGLLTLIGLPVQAARHVLVAPDATAFAIGLAASGLVAGPLLALVLPRVMTIWGKLGMVGALVAAAISVFNGLSRAIAPMVIWAVALWLAQFVGVVVADRRNLQRLQFMATR